MEASSFVQRLKAITSGQAQLKAQTFIPMMLNGWASWLMGLPRTTHNYAAEVGDGLGSSCVMPVIQWIMRVFPEARLVVQQRQGEDWQTVPNHPLLALLQRPNPWYDGGILWMSTVYGWCWFGESYWRVLRTRGGQPGQLWWLPPWSIMPIVPASGQVFIEAYRYQPITGAAIDLDPSEVIHFRHGLDPRNPIRGLPPLRAVLRDIWTDDEAANFVASLLRNSAVTSTLITPDPQAGEGAVISDTMVKTIQAYVNERFTGDDRGKAMFVQGPLKVQRLGFSPQELDLSSPRNVAEERVCSALGIAASVVGFGTGLEQTRVGATMLQEAMMSWTNGLIPMQRIMAGTLGQTLLPLFEPDADNYRLDWDYSKVRALQEDEQAKATRLTTMVQGGWYRVDEARTSMGLESEDSDRVYLRSFSVTEVPAGIPQAPALPEAPALVRGDRAPEAKGQDWRILKAEGDALHRLADRLEPQMRARFLSAVERTKAGINQEFLEDALRSFDGELASRAIPWETFEEVFGRDATALLREAVGQSGVMASRAMNADLQIDTRFDLTNPVAIDWANTHAARMIKDISGRTEVAIRELVAQSLRGQMTWQQVARLTRQVIGLDERRALAVEHFELRLRQEGVAQEVIERRIERYAAAHLRRRAETIARTEIMQAVHAGQDLSFQAAVRDGWLDPATTFRQWIVTDDDRLDPECEKLDGVTVGLREAFPGGIMHPPLHPNCRCTIGLVFDRASVQEESIALVAD